MTGFSTKGIKYSFDVDNVINAFVGENLYNDKLTSLRELLQNSIDTCRYKKVLQPDYVPEIKLYIENEKIKIEDNGLGMDEFIIKNYFGKLCSSFYQQENVKKEYEAIGQFGVGVFSYFMMADYIDIETKTEKSETLHFRLDKDPKNYFHFFKKNDRKVSGTTITLNLKKEYENFSTTDYINYIKDKFRYIEFPISISCDGETIEIIKQEYEEKKIKERINDSLRHQYKSFSDKIEVFTYNFQNKEYEGSISLLYLKDYSFSSIYYLMNGNFFMPSGRHSNLINISQKGVLISNNEDISDYSDIFCNLNLKEKIGLQISRNNFSDKIELSKILHEILKEMSLSFLEKLNIENSTEILPKISFNFIEKKYINFQEEIYPKIFLNFNDSKNIYQSINYQDFLNKELKTFVISYNSKKTFFLNSKIKELNIVEFYLENKRNDFYELMGVISIFNKNNYTEQLIKNDDFYYLEMIKDFSKTKKMSFMRSYGFMNTKNIETINLDISSLLLLGIKSDNENYDSDLNQDHPFVKAIFSYKESELNQKTKELINEIFQLTVNIYEEEKEEEFNSIKELEIELKKHIKIDYELSINDFS